MLRTDFFVRTAFATVLMPLGLSLLLPLHGDEFSGQSKAYALLVGVKTFDHSSLGELRFTENDAEELAKLLDRPGSPFQGRVRVLTSTRGKKNAADMPTAANIRTALQELTSKRTKEETVLVALASHGLELVVAPPGARGRLSRLDGDSSPDDRIYPFFCPSDAQLEGTEYSTGHNERLINLNDLILDTLGQCGAGTKLLLMDACREHAKLPASRALSVNYKQVPEGIAAMFSCKSGQLAYENPRLQHGVFFYFVLKGLSGEARDPASGKVTWKMLDYYVGEAMATESKLYTGDRLQTPQSLLNFVGSDPVLVRLEKAPLAKNNKFSLLRSETPIAPKGIKNSIGMLLKHIPKGKFNMGAPSDAIRKPGEEEHEVEISTDFFMGAYEVTQEQYKTVMHENPSAYCQGGSKESDVRHLDSTNYPVEHVSWFDAENFCKALSELPLESSAARVYRLPTEAEWEYAFRGGKKGKAMPFQFGYGMSVGQANFDWRRPFGKAQAPHNSLNQPCPVGNFEPNLFGLYDLHGNVREWCSDWYSNDYYRNSPPSDPSGPTKGRYRVIRGGSWRQDGNYCRSTHRDRLPPIKSDEHTGFRVVCVIKK